MANAKQTLLKDSVVRTQLVPLEGMQLVLPNTCIAEVIDFQQPEAIEDAPDWLLGFVDWRGIRIPIISFEAINGLTAGQHQKSTRIIVLNGISGNDDMCFYGVIAQGIPRLLSVNKETISSISKPETKLPFSIQQTLVDDQPAVIPDQEKIEKALKKQGVKITA